MMWFCGQQKSKDIQANKFFFIAGVLIKVLTWKLDSGRFLPTFFHPASAERQPNKTLACGSLERRSLKANRKSTLFLKSTTSVCPYMKGLETRESS